MLPRPAISQVHVVHVDGDGDLLPGNLETQRSDWHARNTYTQPTAKCHHSAHRHLSNPIDASPTVINWTESHVWISRAARNPRRASEGKRVPPRPTFIPEHQSTPGCVRTTSELAHRPGKLELLAFSTTIYTSTRPPAYSATL